MRNTIFLLVLVGGLGGSFVQAEKVKLEINKLDCAKNVILTTLHLLGQNGLIRIIVEESSDC